MGMQNFLASVNSKVVYIQPYYSCLWTLNINILFSLSYFNLSHFLSCSDSLSPLLSRSLSHPSLAQFCVPLYPIWMTRGEVDALRELRSHVHRFPFHRLQFRIPLHDTRFRFSLHGTPNFLTMAHQISSPITFSTSRLPCCLKQCLIFHKPHGGGVGFNVGFDRQQTVGFGVGFDQQQIVGFDGCWCLWWMVMVSCSGGG